MHFRDINYIPRGRSLTRGNVVNVGALHSEVLTPAFPSEQVIRLRGANSQSRSCCLTCALLLMMVVLRVFQVAGHDSLGIRNQLIDHSALKTKTQLE